MMMKAMKGGGKGYSETPYSGQQRPLPGEGGNGGRKSDTRGCYNCGAKGHIARNCVHPKRDRNSGMPAREVGIEEGDDGVCWGTCVIEELQDVDAAANGLRTMANRRARRYSMS